MFPLRLCLSIVKLAQSTMHILAHECGVTHSTGPVPECLLFSPMQDMPIFLIVTSKYVAQGYAWLSLTSGFSWKNAYSMATQ